MANLTEVLRHYRSLAKANKKADIHTRELQLHVQKFCEFDIFITTMAGDGICVMTEKDSFPVGMPILDFLLLVKKDGSVNEENWQPSQ